MSMELFMSLTIAVAAACFCGGILWLIGSDVQKRIYLSDERKRKLESKRMLKIRAELLRTAVLFNKLQQWRKI